MTSGHIRCGCRLCIYADCKIGWFYVKWFLIFEVLILCQTNENIEGYHTRKVKALTGVFPKTIYIEKTLHDFRKRTAWGWWENHGNGDLSMGMGEILTELQWSTRVKWIVLLFWFSLPVRFSFFLSFVWQHCLSSFAQSEAVVYLENGLS